MRYTLEIEIANTESEYLPAEIDKPIINLIESYHGLRVAKYKINPMWETKARKARLEREWEKARVAASQ